VVELRVFAFDGGSAFGAVVAVLESAEVVATFRAVEVVVDGIVIDDSLGSEVGLGVEIGHGDLASWGCG